MFDSLPSIAVVGGQGRRREEKIEGEWGVDSFLTAMNSGPSGFNNAPVTRALIVCSALFTIFFGIKGRSQKLAFTYQDLFHKPQLWKLIVTMFAFTSTLPAILLSGIRKTDWFKQVVNYWAEKGLFGFTVFKFRLKRLDGQPVLTTNQVHLTHMYWIRFHFWLL